jgi:hypothetical protein
LWKIISVLEAVHGCRGLPKLLLEGIRDRWAHSEPVHLRAEAAEVARLLSGLDEAFVLHLLNDEAATVRTATVELLGRVEVQDAGRALALVQDRLVIEEQAQVRNDLHWAVGMLLRKRPSK